MGVERTIWIKGVKRYSEERHFDIVDIGGT